LFQPRRSRVLCNLPHTAGASKLDPTLFTAAYKRNRFYMFTRREPADLTELKT
jgi:hypothetical protein